MLLQDFSSKMSSKGGGGGAKKDGGGGSGTVLTEEASGSTNKKPSSKTAIEDIYQKKTQLEHILLRPDTYIGKSLHLPSSLSFLSYLQV